MTRKPSRQPTRKRMAQEWEDMSSMQRRVALAKDVLASLEANEIALAAATGYITAKKKTGMRSNTRKTTTQTSASVSRPAPASRKTARCVLVVL